MHCLLYPLPVSTKHDTIQLNVLMNLSIYTAHVYMYLILLLIPKNTWRMSAKQAAVRFYNGATWNIKPMIEMTGERHRYNEKERDMSCKCMLTFLSHTCRIVLFTRVPIMDE